MTNADKYLKDGVTVDEFINLFRSWYFNQVNWMGGLLEPATVAVEKFLQQTEVKPTLTEDERVILRNIKDDYITIARDKAGELFIATERDENSIRGHNALEFKHDLFQFIKPRRRI